MNASHIYLSLAILMEVVATTSLKASNEFTQLIPSILVVLGYVIAFYCLMLSLRTFPVSIAYAIWCSAGIVLVTLFSWLLYGQKLDLPAVLGMGLIIGGTLVIHLFSNTNVHS